MKNTYFTSYFPLISIILFSVSYGIWTELKTVEVLKQVGVYKGMQEFFSPTWIQFSIFIVCFLIYFMVFAALKLIANTLLELSLLFFTKDSNGESLSKIRMGSFFYLGGGTLSLAFVHSFYGLLIILILATLGYFIFFVYKVQNTSTFGGVIGLVFFLTLSWFTFFISITFVCMRLYNSIIGSLPI
ncbi:DUF5366 family protein [Bacillus sinesaloumensis]|uniref:DUF5366 family protein n=1 Tax=Litchfieldia sinesaloumensis TaxID=1926280 RepID=UPI0009888D63|nr:DUF5366 family protein [Bacillus sinesaloumensis]